MRQVLSLGGYEPKKVRDMALTNCKTASRHYMCAVQGLKFQVLQPILETFDLEGIASFIKKGDNPQIMCRGALFQSSP